MKEIHDINDPRVAKALAHPLRLRILGILEQRVTTPKELAAELGTSLEALSYHVRALAQYGLIELVERRQKRGAVEHHYRAARRPWVSDEAWAAVPEIARKSLLGGRVAQLAETVNAAVTDGGFDGGEAHLVQRALRLDAEGLQELSAALRRVEDEVEAIERRSGERLGDGQAAATGAVLALLLFESAGPAAAKAKEVPQAAVAGGEA